MKIMQPPKLFIFDSTNLLYRSYHGNEKLTGPGGFPTGAIYGFVNSMLLVTQQYPDYQPVFVFDTFPAGCVPPHPSDPSKSLISTVPNLDSLDRLTRRELYIDYKATRSPMPPELQQQVLPLLLILKAMGYPVVGGNSVLEADDVIGTLSVEAQKRGGSAIVGTSDKDMAALVNDTCLMYNFNLKKLLDSNGIMEKYGVPPDKIAGFLALMGDTTDNIPGVKKCGEKTAAKWMNTYGTLDNVIANAANIGGVVGANLREALHILPLAYSLTLLRTDTPIAFEACTTGHEPDMHLLRHVYQGLGFQKFLQQLDNNESKKTSTQSQLELA